MLKNSFKASDSENWALIPHVDAIFDKAKEVPLNGTKEDARELFDEAGNFHYDMGETGKAEGFFGKTSELADNGSKFKAHADMKLAKTLFLKGKDWFSQAIDLAKSAEQYFEQNNDLEELLECKNGVLLKIHQRKCEFDKAEALFKDIIDISAKEERFKDKLSGIYHNLASLHWTWGRETTPEGKGKNDYETSVHYFHEALKAGSEAVAKLEKKKMLAKTEEDKKKLGGTIEIKRLYRNVSRMIFGAVYGLLKEFDKQTEQHEEALTYFKDKAKEKRRLAYTAYYMLSYGWDKEQLNEEDSDIGKCNYFDQPGFTEMELMQLIEEQSVHLGKDEKYELITKIVKLRLAVRQKTNPDKYANAPATFTTENLYEAFVILEGQLEEMKYTPEKDGVQQVRYYDVDTCSVSAVLDYGAYLLSAGESDKAKEAMTLARAMTKDIMYHREPELTSVCKKLNMI